MIYPGFEFTVDKQTNTIVITKAFDATLPLVWDAFTKPEILDQWGAPEPWVAKTKYMDFRPGGRRLYSMTSEEGQEHWSIQEFTSITPKSNFRMLTNFADKDGNVNPKFDSSQNNLDFSETNGFTIVKIRIQYASPAVLSMMVEGGFREGFTRSVENLERLLASMIKK